MGQGITRAKEGRREGAPGRRSRQLLPAEEVGYHKRRSALENKVVSWPPTPIQKLSPRPNGADLRGVRAE